MFLLITWDIDTEADSLCFGLSSHPAIAFLPN